MKYKLLLLCLVFLSFNLGCSSYTNNDKATIHLGGSGTLPGNCNCK